MDVRHPMTDFDQQLIEWAQFNNKPLHILLTKADKLRFGAAKNTMLTVQRELQAVSIPLTIQLYSALKKTGIDEIHEILDDWFRFSTDLNKPGP